MDRARAQGAEPLLLKLWVLLKILDTYTLRHFLRLSFCRLTGARFCFKRWTAGIRQQKEGSPSGTPQGGEICQKGTKDAILTSYPGTDLQDDHGGCIFEILEFSKGTNNHGLLIPPTAYHATMQKIRMFRAKLKILKAISWGHYSCRGKEALTTRAERAKFFCGDAL